MRRLDKDIAAIVQAQYFARFEFGNEIRSDVNVAAADETTFDSRSDELVLESIDPYANIGSRIVIDPRKEMWCAGDNFHAARDSDPRHCQGFVQILGPVVYSREEVAVEIYQGPAP